MRNCRGIEVDAGEGLLDSQHVIYLIRPCPTHAGLEGVETPPPLGRVDPGDEGAIGERDDEGLETLELFGSVAPGLELLTDGEVPTIVRVSVT